MKRHPLYDKYTITKEGRIFRGEKELKGSNPKNHKGYIRITIHHNGQQLTKNLHRLVAETYISDYNEILEVNHKDGNKLNNNLSNLEMSSRAENALHAKDIGLYKSCEDVHTSILTNEQVHLICSLFEEGHHLTSVLEKMGYSSKDGNMVSNISKIKNRKTWTNISKNYKWTDSVDYKTYAEKDLIVMYILIDEGYPLKKIAKWFTKYDSKKLYNTLKKMNQGKLYSKLKIKSIEERSTTIEKYLVIDIK